MVQEVPEVTLAVLGDETSGTYGVIAAHRPDVICVGYDQHGLAEDVREKMAKGMIREISVVQLKSYQSEKFHTSHLSRF